MDSLKSYIIEKSKEFNIDICGLADCSSSDSLKKYLIYRQENGITTDFEEKNIDKRIDPTLTLENCKSIIVVGISYNVDIIDKPSFDLRGRLSKSSWGMDYHNVLRAKLKDFIEELEKTLDFKHMSFVDTGPMVDRHLANKAAIGYYGKNCSIINEYYGSFIFLGYILTDLEIESDEKMESQCGDCTLCIQACPTKALESPYRLNPKKCISYLTQTKDEIPLELREKMGIKIYGCDTCQLVCPKNKSINKSNHKEFIPENGGYIDLEDLLNISNRDFKKKYGHMAGSWRGKTILKRNAIIALGNMKSIKNVKILEKQLNDDNSMIVEYARWAIENINNSQRK